MGHLLRGQERLFDPFVHCVTAGTTRPPQGELIPVNETKLSSSGPLRIKAV